MNTDDRIARYLAQAGRPPAGALSADVTPAGTVLLNGGPVPLTPAQRRRVVRKDRSGKAHRHGDGRCTLCRPLPPDRFPWIAETVPRGDHYLPGPARQAV